MARRLDHEDPEDNDKAVASPPVTHRPSLLMSRNLVFSFLAFGVLVLVGSLAFTIVSSKRADADEEWTVVRRSDWKAAPPMSVSLLRTPAQYVAISQTATEGCSTQAQCRAMVYAMQQQDLQRGFSDITHNFVIGSNGTVFEGRGWGVQCPHRHVRASPSLAASLIGTFTRVAPSRAQLDAIRRLIRVGVRYGYITTNYTLLADFEQQASFFPFERPGHKLLEEISTWPHWSTTL